MHHIYVHTAKNLIILQSKHILKLYAVDALKGVLLRWLLVTKSASCFFEIMSLLLQCYVVVVFSNV